MRRTVNELERLFASICNEAYPNEWDENFVSFQLMQKLRNLFARKVISFTNFSKIVEWRSFKNSGLQENKYGDIALLVNIQFTTNEILKGVACLEAKRQFNGGKFNSIDLQQLERIYNNLPYSHLLLYCYKPLCLPMKFPNEAEHNSYVWTSPLNTAIPLLKQVSQNENNKVFRTSLSFAAFLTSRVFWGLDLDYREAVYNDILNGNNGKVDPSYLGVINIYYEGQRPLNVELSDIWQEI